MLEQWIKENAKMEDGESVAVVNDDVWILPPRCFSNMPGLKKVILPYNLRKIGAFSFAGCGSLEVIDIPRQVVLIDDGAFYGCCSLKAINIPDNVVGIGSMAFAGTDLNTITLPKSVRYIDDGAFADCPRINQISLPENLYDIPYTEMDKDQFCEAYKNNTDNLAVKIKMAYVEKRTREQVDVCHRLEAEEKKWQNTVKELRSEISLLTRRLEREQEWKPYEDVSGRFYENIANNGVSPASDEETVRFVSTHFGFDMTKISIKRVKPLYEINRHQQLRQAGVTVRNPYIFASDWNYVYFSSMGIDYEILNGKIIPL